MRGVTNPANPRILITRAEDVVGERWDDYADCVRRAGGEPSPADMTDYPPGAAVGPFDGLVLTAGVDVDPARYGEERSDRVREIDPARDAFEESLLAIARERDRPVLAICRGHQLFNVAAGGGLLQHLEDREPHRARRGADGESIDSGWHPVDVAPGSLLASIAGPGPLRVNSRHHQAVLGSTVAASLTIAATASDGVVEALEDPAHRWALSVQWHPERPEMTDDPALRSASIALFEAFVATCAAGTAAGSGVRAEGRA